MTLSPTGTLVQKVRINSIDLMRGIVMVIMALDHTRDFFHISANVFQPTDLTQTNPLLFFTRWITHFCAPTFVLLSGVAIRISQQRKTKKELSIFLLTRGLWLLLLEFTIIRFSFFFNLTYDFSVLQVIWVIGASMIVLSGLLYLPEKAILAIGLIIVFGHNVFDYYPLKPEDSGYAIWAVLRQTAFLSLAEGKFLAVMYPLFPWLGIMLVGYGLGKWYTKEFDVTRRQKLLLYTGLASIGLFVVLRAINIYGDGAPWSVQKNTVFTVLSFLNCTKYPVSLLYTLMTLGPVLVILSWMEKVDLKVLNPIVVFGRVPLFYYIFHFYLIHIVSLAIYMISHNKSLAEVDFSFNNSFGGIPFGVGYSLLWVYVAWIGVVIFLYPFCKWYNTYKSSSGKVWVSYL